MTISPFQSVLVIYHQNHVWTIGLYVLLLFFKFTALSACMYYRLWWSVFEKSNFDPGPQLWEWTLNWGWLWLEAKINLLLGIHFYWQKDNLKQKISKIQIRLTREGNFSFIFQKQLEKHCLIKEHSSRSMKNTADKFIRRQENIPQKSSLLMQVWVPVSEPWCHLWLLPWPQYSYRH